VSRSSTWGAAMSKRAEPPRLAPWRQYVRARADAIESDMQRHATLTENNDKPQVQPIYTGISRHLEAARKAAGEYDYPSRWRRFLDLCAGSSIECAFRRLHAAKIMMVWLLPSEEVEAHIPEALARLRKCLHPGDPRLAWAEAKLLADKYVADGQASPQPRRDQGDSRLAWADAESGALQQVMIRARNHTLEIDLDSANPPLVRAERQTDLDLATRRVRLRNIVRLGYDASDEQHARLRSFRNVVAVATLVLTLLTIGIAILGAFSPSSIPLCFQPEGKPMACPTGKQPTGGDAALVATLGLLGGALSGALAIRRLQGGSTPYQIPVVLSLFKLPSGALTSIVGILLLRGEFVPGFTALDTQEQILAYAVVFGFAQQLATRLIDRQAREVVDRIPTKEPSPGRAAVPSGASPAAPLTSDLDG
jgi:hypothetical protein